MWQNIKDMAFKSEIDDKLKNNDEHDDDNDVSNENDENTDPRKATKDIAIEIDDAHDNTACHRASLHQASS